MAGREALKIKAFAGMPSKKANFKSHMNQRLTITMGFVAPHGTPDRECGTAPQILCISDPDGKKIFLGFLPKRLDGADFAP